MLTRANFKWIAVGVSSSSGRSHHFLFLPRLIFLLFLHFPQWKVREGAIRAMADIYRMYVTSEEADGDRKNVARLESYRNCLLKVYYHQNLEDR